jgi:hypothetical protein
MMTKITTEAEMSVTSKSIGAMRMREPFDGFPHRR